MWAITSGPVRIIAAVPAPTGNRHVQVERHAQQELHGQQPEHPERCSDDR